MVLHVSFRTNFGPSCAGQCADIVLPLPLRRAHVLFIVDLRRCQCAASNFNVSFVSGQNFMVVPGRFDASHVLFFSLPILRGGRRASRWGIPVAYRAKAAMPRAWACQIAHHAKRWGIPVAYRAKAAMPRAGTCQIAHCAEATVPRAGACQITHRAEAAVPCAGACQIAHRAEAAAPRAGACQIAHRAEAAVPCAGACQIAHCAEAAVPRARASIAIARRLPCLALGLPSNLLWGALRALPWLPNSLLCVGCCALRWGIHNIAYHA